MADYDYLDVRMNNLPEEFEHDIGTSTYVFRIYYCNITDNFYIDIRDRNGVPLVLGEKLVYNEPLFISVSDPRLPMTEIVPRDDNGVETNVSALNFPSIIHLEFIDNEPIDDDVQDADDNEDDSTEIPDNNNDNPTQVYGNQYGGDPTIGGDNQ